jgi:hypothetical protein
VEAGPWVKTLLGFWWQAILSCIRAPGIRLLALGRHGWCPLASRKPGSGESAETCSVQELGIQKAATGGQVRRGQKLRKSTVQNNVSTLWLLFAACWTAKCSFCSHIHQLSGTLALNGFCLMTVTKVTGKLQGALFSSVVVSACTCP